MCDALTLLVEDVLHRKDSAEGGLEDILFRVAQ